MDGAGASCSSDDAHARAAFSSADEDLLPAAGRGDGLLGRVGNDGLHRPLLTANDALVMLGRGADDGPRPPDDDHQADWDGTGRPAETLAQPVGVASVHTHAPHSSGPALPHKAPASEVRSSPRPPARRTAAGRGAGCREYIDLLGRKRLYFSAEEIARHNTKDDCWLVAHGKVYDVTS